MNPLDQKVSSTPVLDDLDLKLGEVLPNPTPEQSAFMDQLAKGTGSILLGAVAGSGKTTTLEAGAAKVKGQMGLACAFNVKIKEKLAEVMPKSFEVKTLNGLGHSAWARQLGGKRLSLDKDKVYAIMNSKWEYAELQDYPDLKKLVDLARGYGIVPTGAKGMSKGQDDEEFIWQELIDNHEVDISGEGQVEQLIDMAAEVLRESISQAWSGVIDFPDQLYMPTIFKAPFRRYPLLLVDEAQDLSAIQHRMLAMSLATGGRVVAVGDKRQAIYGFRGAHTDGMEALRQHFSATEMPLTVSFRCPQAVVKEAQALVPEIQAWSGAPEGIVGHSALEHIKPGDAVICRFNKPLFKLAFKLIRKGLGPKILGRDIGQGLIRIVKKFGGLSAGEMAGPLLNWSSGQIEMLRARRKNGQAELLADKVECILILCEEVGASASTDRIVDAIDRLFSDTGGVCTLGTIHKMKGLEYNRVHFLGRGSLPPRWVEEGTWQMQQEMNAIYIGITRAKKELYYMREDSK